MDIINLKDSSFNILSQRCVEIENRSGELRKRLFAFNPYLVEPSYRFSQYNAFQILHKGFHRLKHIFMRVICPTYRNLIQAYQDLITELDNTKNAITIKLQTSAKSEPNGCAFLNLLSFTYNTIFPRHTLRKNVHETSYQVEFDRDIDRKCLIKGYSGYLHFPSSMNIKIDYTRQSIQFDGSLKADLSFKGINFPVVIHEIGLNSSHVKVDVELQQISWFTSRVLSALGKTSSFSLKTRIEKLEGMLVPLEDS